MTRLSSPLGDLREHYEVVVIGSGYGGAIAACRLARDGRQVCVLERGKERWPGEFPDTVMQGCKELQITTAKRHIGSDLGLFDLHTEPDMNVLVGCGLGGTSLINANVSIRPDRRLWDLPCWPDELRRDVNKGLEDGYDRAWAMLRPTEFPRTLAAPPKLTALQRAADAAGDGAAFTKVHINVAFEAGLNAAGVHQDACTHCGDCVSGCNVGAKTTTLMTYLPDAKAHGAEIFTQVRVRSLSRQADRWIVHLEALGVGRECFNAPELTVSAETVVLAAGTLGSTEILLRSGTAGLSLSGRVGHDFSGNGDVLGFAYDSDVPVDGVGFGRHPRTKRVGPTITGVIDLRKQGALADGQIVEEGAIPGALAALLPPAFAVAAAFDAHTTRPTVVGALRRAARTAVSLVAGARHGALRRTLTFLVMGHDDNRGVLKLEGDRIRVHWDGVGSTLDFRRVNGLLEGLTAGIRARFVPDPIWSELFGKKLITIHPLGGCVIAPSADKGVVNHRCQVFSGKSGTDVHESLYVMDGSVIPVSLGVNPLLTISALAERAVALICEARGQRVDDSPVTAPIAFPTPPKAGLRFTETLSGAGTVRDAATDVSFTITIEVDDVEALLADPAYRAKAAGTVDAPGVCASPLTVTQGTFRLFVPDPTRVDTQHMEYRLPLSQGGDHWFLAGDKTLDCAGPFAAWGQTTTLAVRLYDGADESAPLLGTGTLTISPRDLARQLRTMQIINAASEAERLRWLARFGRLFAGDLVEHYGTIAAPAQLFDPDGPLRTRRQLRAPVPVVYPVTTEDGKALRLTRFDGGGGGDPVLVVHGAGVSSGIFSTDLPATNLVEALVALERDVWLFDFRASTALRSSREASNADDVARYDHPAAVAKVLEVTGRERLQAVVHCYGSNTFVMSLLAGWTDPARIRSVVCSQVAAHLKVGALHRLEAGLRFPNVLEDLGVTTLTAYVDARSGWRSHALDGLLRFPLLAPRHQRCTNPVCHRVTFLYGLLYQHEQLGQAIHDGLHELFGVTTTTSLEHLALMVRHGHVVRANGQDTYLEDANVKRLDLPILLLSGSENHCYLPASTQQTYDLLCRVNGPANYERKVIPGYGHIDCIFGENAARDVYPTITDFLSRT